VGRAFPALEELHGKFPLATQMKVSQFDRNARDRSSGVTVTEGDVAGPSQW
jgi:hypothetical protein